jgi:apolipoprotein N-acyltransferase
MLSLTRPDGVRDDLAGITHVVWPEAAMPFLPLNHPEALRAIADVLPEGTTLLAGALRIEDDASSPFGRRGYNSLMVFGADGSLSAVYDKIHLVPFGEYLPLQALLESLGLEQLTRWRGGFSAGASPRPLLTVPGLPPVGALICYEAIFPGAVVQGQQRPQLLVNVTNDGWFGNTTGPQQHFHQARVRAVEEGLPLIRVANNGISAVIDPEGRLLGRLALNERGTIDADVPHARAAPPYAQYGDLPFLLCWLALLVWLSAGAAAGAGRERACNALSKISEQV